ncbi:unnamed protein product [Adineta steineri]|uniref:Uncharacterized protein n=1 Tax=Adineta steineri TaxID=433720 RepID=A0A814R3Y7_9BILA|nr:unnamed protein product [Adineta steineri]CAF1469099.1 unnamed protein product [Adineta steineri]CAF1469634.1 unnamed protein product [Adineta steineri]
MNDQRAVLLDSENRHSPIESNLGHRVQYFTDRNTCIQYIQNQMTTCQRIDLFLSYQDKNIIGNQLVLFHNVYFHIYYPTINDIPNNNQPCMWIQPFEELELWVKISYVIYHHDWMYYMQSNYSQVTRVNLRITHNILLEETKAAKLGIQPNH